MDIKSIIDKKRSRNELTENEIIFFISQYMKKEITDAQAGVLLNCMYEVGLTDNEIIFLAKAMSENGKKIDLGEMSENTVDKHSTGGVGDKVTLILIPVLAALGIPVAKLSSRGMGVAFGTIEKLETIPGYTTEIPIEEFQENLKKVGVGILSQTKNLNPAENKIYRLRNEIYCIDSIPIITASLLSLKLSTGAKKIVFEINYGKGTYIKDKNMAINLAKTLNRIGRKLERDVICTICPMDEPLGYSIGNNLEMIEAIEALNGRMTEDLGMAVVTIASAVLKITTGSKNMKENEEKVKEVIRNKKALKKFKDMVKAQYGNVNYIDKKSLFDKASHIVPVHAVKSGYVKSINSEIIGNIARYLGAGRMHNENLIDNTAGIVLKKKIGDIVVENEIIAYIHTNEEKKIKPVFKNLIDAFELSSSLTKPLNKIPKII